MSSVDVDGAKVGTGSAAVNGVNTEVLVAAIIFFFMAVIFTIFIYIYVKTNWGSNSTSRAFGTGVDDHREGERRLGGAGGLDPTILNKIPVTVHRTSDGKGDDEARECAVCLSVVVDGERIRVLPGCKHGFHVDCIDMWFHSHSTCPMCRHPLATPAGGISTEGYTPEVPDLPTDVLFWGSRREAVVIDVPVRDTEEMAASSTSTSSSPPPPSPPPPAPRALPAATPRRLTSFTRLFSMGKRAVGETSSDGDIERAEEKTS